MCGIVAYIGGQNATPIIVNGLKKLEYRGYDSAGVAVLQNGKIEVRRDAGKIARLEALIAEQPLSGSIGIGHTRWATHGAPNQQNAHPHLSSNGEIVIVHNGIVENYLSLRDELLAEGAVFHSETDTETIVFLIERYFAVTQDLAKAVQLTMKRVKGAHGIVVMSAKEPDKLLAARLGNAGGVAIGRGNGEMFIASDLPAIVEHTREITFLENGQMAVVTRQGVSIQTLDGQKVPAQIQHIPWDPVSAEKGNYRHFMQKEIHEQVRSLSDTMIGRIDFDDYRITLPDLRLDAAGARGIKRIFITACGTALHAGLVGKTIIEHLTRIPVEVMVASEFRYIDPIVDSDTVVLAISQSGETADTLAAMEEGRRKGAKLWSIVNAIGSQAMRSADGAIAMQVGPEIGVASTKAFTAPLVDLYMLAVYLADLRGNINPAKRFELIRDLLMVPTLAGKTLEHEPEVEKAAAKYKDMRSVLYLGRGINMPIAYEGALKLKEISYIHAEGYPAGEMKHGPIALIDQDLPVVVIAPKDAWYEKMISQVEQAKARGGKVIAVATEGDALIPTLVDEVLWVPPVPWLLSPILTSIPLQLFAYHIATQLGLDVDQPRNLAKSVTVE
ncbi:MAG TPA: glutamine--fructose-6-phosphate transaminase (isomerizing) [Anaerolineaceae bacterium]|jgi:glucosamine--fructose-6-phosphate aminotransferase (isomerizing)|nr:glutamine--fructose-6-phosphate transaminase (isomerizing) [Anaerolineaceae bacterium]HOE35018.1 glutamine--fructose-6-phosphate transaminase (isomerizing) [Anaerolineaceae bacterium]HOT25952.1 glutamine--fructose-6-phosphate transaminase (isomerizing) [Anaerolineaceae bacterium]HQK03561.1 glutamine--fructose-6-phosphate transaminase (isomerizing) [Anaerolineaceae bacterium]